jgi:hypothetical protein
MWKVKSHLDVIEIDQDFDNRDSAELEMRCMADELAELLGAHVFHDSIGLSTVWDEDDHVCFWLSEE